MNLKIKTGFTLIELLVTLAIIGIMAALALFGTQGIREQARDGKRKSDLETLRSALEVYKSDCNDYPLSITFGGQLNGDGTPANSCAASNIYIQRVPTDPQSPARTYSYARVSPTQYNLCANLEQNPTPVNNSGCATCAGTGGCDFKVTNP